jgi:hypothetical protein
MTRSHPESTLPREEVVSRRGLLLGTGGLGAALTVGASVPAALAAPAAFAHPGMLHNHEDIRRARRRVSRGGAKALASWSRLVDNPHSQATWRANPLPTVIRGGDGQNYGILYRDIAAAYQNALRWRISRDRAHGRCARDILNAWSATLTEVTGNADRFLAAGIYGWQLANAAELVRDFPGFDLDRFQRMMREVFYPLNHQFLTDHNGACITNYWANWDLCNVASVLAIGILCDDADLYDEARTYFMSGAGNGSIRNAVPFLHRRGGVTLGQWQESGRDQGHTVMGMGQMGAICEMAWNQGEDLYSYDDRRFMRAAQYVARYNLGMGVPFRAYTWGTGQSCDQRSHTVISPFARGQHRPVWAMLQHHYAHRLGRKVNYITAMTRAVGPEGGGGDFGPNSGGYDQLGFGTLMYAN